MAWSVESLPSNPAARVRFQVGSGILIFVLGLGVCILCVLSCVSDGGPDIVLTTHSGRAVLVYLSSVLVQRLLLPYRHLTHGHLGYKYRGVVLDWGRVNKRRIIILVIIFIIIVTNISILNVIVESILS